MSTPINLHLLGFSDNAKHSLQIALNNRASGTCHIETSHPPDVVLVDLDEIRQPQLWKAISQNGSIRLIATVSNPDQLNGYASDFSAVITKPIRFTQILSAIQQAAGQSEQSPPGTRPHQHQAKNTSAVPIADKNYQSMSHIDSQRKLVQPNQYLLGKILEITQSPLWNLPYLLQWSETQWLILVPGSKKAILSIKPKVMRHCAIERVDDMQLNMRSLVGRELDQLSEQACWTCDLEELLWLLAYWTVRGRQLESLQLDQPFKLKHWPNLTRYATSDVDIPLASYWVESSASVKDLVEKFGFPENKVLGFAACCQISGLLEPVGNKVEQMPPPKPRGLKRVFNMILRKLAA